MTATKTSADVHNDGIPAAPVAEKPSPKRRRTTVPALDRIPSAGRSRGRGAVDILLASPSQQLVDLPLALLDPHPHNLRDDVGDIKEMAAEMKGLGVLEPLLVASADAFWSARGVTDNIDSGRYVILAGHRRHAAAKAAGLTDVPCIIRDDLAADAEAAVTMLVENLHREGLQPLEEARGYRLLEELGKSQTAIAELVGCSQANVSKKLALLRLPPEVALGVADGDLSIDDAVKLSKYADDKEILRAAQTRPSYETVDQAADRINRRRQRDAETAATVEKAKKDGYTGRIVPYPSGNVFTDLTQRLRYGTGPVTVDALAKGGVDVRDHDALPCHARAIGYDANAFNPQLHDVVICTKPEAHHAESSLGKQKAAEERKAARDKAQRETQAAARRELVTRAIAGKRSKELDELLDAVLVEIIDQYLDEEAMLVALTFLGADVDDDRYAGDVWREYLAKAPANRPRAIAAALLGDVENDVTSGYVRSTHGAPYLRWLQSLGHNVKGDERKIVQAKS